MAAANAGNRRPAPETSQPLLALLGPVSVEAGLDLEDVEVRAAGRRRLVRVLVDAEHGVSLDQIAEVSRAISDALDASDLLGDQPYTLEVSSPGVDRPLTQPRHWRRNAGRLVEVKPATGAVVTGRILRSDDAGVELDLPTGRETLAYADITRAQVQVEFRRDDAVPKGEGP